MNINRKGSPQTEIWEFVACGIRNDGIWNPEFSVQVIRNHTNDWKWNPSSAVKESESAEAQRWDEMLILFTIRLKVNYHVLVAFPSFYSFLFIDPLPLFTDMVLILFRKVISEISKKKRKTEHP